ncbi:glycosyltransferase family 87 protein [Intrasporangium sp. YIM S08009]|uniref:glycosyltransferase family 87 protein n=1 Tax=Intrasporangium zincisolvens TaxID=3080018 RepID=UPI002B0597C8|nr:glycosyltransferase family 87 protein [Intrasporangium sp. YIM S08009]
MTRPGDHAEVETASTGPEVPEAAGGRRQRRSEELGRVVRLALWVSLPVALWVLALSRLDTFGTDSAHAYWSVWRVSPYGVPPGTPDAYNYSPAFAQLIWPLTLLPWPAFLLVWSGLLAAALVWLLWPLPQRWRWLTLLYVVPPALVIGNIEAFLAVSCALGLRRRGAWAWALPLLTKVTPGLGPVWFAVRREWRSLGLSLGVTGAIVLVSYLAAPDLWSRWVAFLLDSPTPPTQEFYPPLLVRLPVAVVLAAWAARRSRPAWLAAAMVIAMPLWSSGVLILLAAIPRTVRQRTD